MTSIPMNVPTPSAAQALALPIPLTELSPGMSATLYGVQDPESRVVLRALGLTDACRLRVCKLGDPCIVQVRSTRIGLSRTVAQNVLVISHGEGS
jgi:Fe2+ transport system protein FeoA